MCMMHPKHGFMAIAFLTECEAEYQYQKALPPNQHMNEEWLRMMCWELVSKRWAK